MQLHFSDEAARDTHHQLAAFLAPAQGADGQRRPGAGDAHIHQPALFLEALRRHFFGIGLEGQQAFVDAGQKDMGPFQALGGVQGGQRHLVLLITTLGHRQDHADRLRHLQHGLFIVELFIVLNAAAAAALGDPVDEVEHIAPACRGDFFVLFVVEQVLLVIDVLQPFEQQGLGGSRALGVLGAVFELGDIAAKFMQRAERTRRQSRAERFGKQGLEHAAFPAAGELAQTAQGLVADAALGRGDCAQKCRVVVLVDQQAQPGTEVLDFALVEEALPA